ncbi:helix-turn-helix domain-containing protein [Aquimarina sp. AD10]|uniref:helix-turn-helix domain-containing protein n=1 Tax=Aquimarina sp. AD10 TaxID=1714849 RepID=UPI0011C411EE|nr:helix-turn-helix domain-containing protein [Aquimarina sp. AD10]
MENLYSFFRYYHVRILYKRVVVFLILINTINVFSQEKIDSLQNKTYIELADAFFNEDDNKDTIAATSYATYFLDKAKKEDFLERIAQGFNLLAHIHKGQDKLNYLDSIIQYTKDANLKEYPLEAYIHKTGYYYAKRDLKKALDNCIQANLYADRSDNENQKIRTKFRIGLIKTRLGYYEETLEIFKDCADGYLKESSDNSYLTSLYAIADTYRHLKLLDSASFYNEKGIKTALSKGYEERYYYFLLNEGANQYDKNNYQKSIDYIDRAIPYLQKINDKPNVAMGYHFLGKVYKQLNDNEKSELYLKKVDTIYQETSDIHPELRSGYEILIDIYRKNGDTEQQLLYIEKLLKIDSLLKSNYEYLTKKLTKEYDTPKLINERDIIIKKLENKNIYWSISLLITLAAFGVVLVYNYKRQQINKKKFEEYLSSQKRIDKPIEVKSDELLISQDIQDHINRGLEKFEKNKGYLNDSISLNSLAKQLHTNTNYLSKMVNHYQEKSFGSYINELRLEHTIERLKTDLVFRKYSIKAISEEVGFKSPESFSKAFYKKTQLKPSTFIKQLKKEG